MIEVPVKYAFPSIVSKIKMKEVVFHYVKKCTLVVANKTTLLHGKDNTFRSGHPEVAERFDQIFG